MHNPLRTSRCAACLAVSLALLTAGVPTVAASQEPFGTTPTPDVVFVPTPPAVVSAMLALARVAKSDVVYDLGSGDGRIVIAAAEEYGARGVGIDIDPVRIREARTNAEKAGVTDRVRFIQADLFESDISPATVVTLYPAQLAQPEASADPPQ